MLFSPLRSIFSIFCLCPRLSACQIAVDASTQYGTLIVRNPTSGLMIASVATFAALDAQPEVQAKIAEFLAVYNQTRTVFDLGLTDSILELYK